MLRLTIFVTLFALCASHAGYRLMIPNGINVPDPCPNGTLWNGVGHDKEPGGGNVNVFGVAFKAANHTWTMDLCHADSDTDGRSNGVELGDPDCTWKTGMPYPGDATGHPGICEPMSDAKCKNVNSKIICNRFPDIFFP